MEKKLNNEIYWLTKEVDSAILEKEGNIISLLNLPSTLINLKLKN